jgi:hypothetical protein
MRAPGTGLLGVVLLAGAVGLAGLGLAPATAEAHGYWEYRGRPHWHRPPPRYYYRPPPPPVYYVPLPRYYYYRPPPPPVYYVPPPPPPVYYVPPPGIGFSLHIR